MTSAVPTSRRVKPADLTEAWSGAATWTQTAGRAQTWRVTPAHLERIMSVDVEELASS